MPKPMGMIDLYSYEITFLIPALIKPRRLFDTVSQMYDE